MIFLIYLIAMMIAVIYRISNQGHPLILEIMVLIYLIAMMDFP